ncbi:bifunctional phosphopantothenoylcysteine decarboxylase/phosphopantothenate--cysteine ligase CoaBC, partial [Glutamicibacter creatinolyticus]
MKRIVLGVSAGIAAYKSVLLLRLLREAGHHVDVIPTGNVAQFVGNATFEALSGNPVTSNVFDAVDTVNHVRLGQEADLVVVVPATADLLAKAAAGIANDLLTGTLLATRAPVVMAPAMHTEMWQHPATVANVATLRQRGVHVIDPAVGRLTGKDSGPGRLPEPEEIFQALQVHLGEPLLAGRSVLITAGGTREPLDPVRFLGNRSSGRQGV